MTFKVFIELDALFNFRSAKAAIDHIIANEGNGPHRGPPGPHQQHHGGGGGGGGGSGFFEMMVAGHKVSAIQNLFFLGTDSGYQNNQIFDNRKLFQASLIFASNLVQSC